MSDYTVVKVSDVSGSGSDLGIAPDVEIRFLRNDLGCEDCGVSYARIAPNGKRANGHRHKRQEEVYLLVSGICAHQGRGRRRGHGAVDGRSCSGGHPSGTGSRPRGGRFVASARRTRAGRRDRRARFLEGLGSRAPAADAPLVVLVLDPEPLAQLGLLVEDDEQLEEDGRDDGPDEEHLASEE